MKKLYIDIRFAKCLLALTAGWLMAGCSAEDELGNGSAAQQLSMTPMVNACRPQEGRKKRIFMKKLCLLLTLRCSNQHPANAE